MVFWSHWQDAPPLRLCDCSARSALVKQPRLASVGVAPNLVSCPKVGFPVEYEYDTAGGILSYPSLPPFLYTPLPYKPLSPSSGLWPFIKATYLLQVCIALR